MEDHYMGKLGLIALSLTVGTVALVDYQNRPLEAGHYKGNINGSVAVLEVVNRGGEIRNCNLTVVSPGETETLADSLCNAKGVFYFTSNKKQNELTQDDIKTAIGWVNNKDNKVTREVAENLIQKAYSKQ
jgi:hypothetical protein